MLKMGNDEYKVEDVLAVYFKNEDEIELVDYNHDIHIYTRDEEPDFDRKIKYCKGKLHKNMFIIDNRLFIRLVRIHSIVKIGSDIIRVRYGYREHEEYNLNFDSEEVRDNVYRYFNRQLKYFYQNTNPDNMDVIEISEFDVIDMLK